MLPFNARRALGMRSRGRFLLTAGSLLVGTVFLQGCVGTTAAQQYAYLVVPCDTPGAIQTGTMAAAVPTNGASSDSAAGAAGAPISPSETRTAQPSTSTPPVCIVAAAVGVSRGYSSSRYYPVGYSAGGFYPYGYAPGYYRRPLYTSFGFGYFGGGHGIGHFGGHFGGGGRSGGGHGGGHH